MKVLLLVAVALAVASCDYPLPENWRDARDPLETEHYQEILSQYFPQYVDFGDEDDETEGGGDGKQMISRHITGGSIAELGQFGHHVLMYLFKGRYSYICGASLVRYNWVITAAHCTYDMTSFALYFGIVDRSSSAQWLEEIKDLSHVTMHPYYNDNTLENDIAMLFLPTATEELLTYPNVAIVSLPTVEQSAVSLTNRKGTVCGFGRTNDSSSESSNVLRYIVRPIISNDACERVFEIFPTNLCIDTTGGQSTCSGDSGGGLLTEIDDDEPVLVGIVSFGAAVGCTQDYPTGFAAIRSYLDWIELVFNGSDDTYTASTVSTLANTELPDEEEMNEETTDDESMAGAVRQGGGWIAVLLVTQFLVFALVLRKS